MGVKNLLNVGSEWIWLEFWTENALTLKTNGNSSVRFIAYARMIMRLVTEGEEVGVVKADIQHTDSRSLKKRKRDILDCGCDGQVQWIRSLMIRRCESLSRNSALNIRAYCRLTRTRLWRKSGCRVYPRPSPFSGALASNVDWSG